MGSNQYKKRDFGKRGFPSKCICGSGVCTFTSKTQENPGRPFYRCETMRDEHLLKWVVDSVLEEMEDALPRLENTEKEVYKLKSEVESLMGMNQEMKDQMRKWKICSGMVCLMILVSAIVHYFY